MNAAVQIKHSKIAVLGNPNSGKTTLFNGLTGSNQRVGNWPGVTVEQKSGTTMVGDTKLEIIDLPGVYSLTSHSIDERIARDYMLEGDYDLVLNIVDATNLERNLFLTAHLIEMKVPVVLVLNMMDLVNSKKMTIDVEKLSEELDVPIISLSAINGSDVEDLKNNIFQHIETRKISKRVIEFPNELEEVIKSLTPQVKEIAEDIGCDGRWVVTRLLEEDEWVSKKATLLGSVDESEISQVTDKLEKTFKESIDIVVADYIYGFIHGVCASVVSRPASRVSVSEKIDRVVMNKFLGIPIFLGVMYLLFWIVMQIGGAFIDFFDILFGTVFVDGFGTLLGSVGAPEWLITILAGGVGAGIQTVSTFVPIVFMMFLLLSLLEDSGYMSRAAFVMDRLMRFIGLPGKAFVPMLLGFGCTVPAVMATRTLENKRDRFLTVFMTPFMSCGARLPVYALFAAAFFPQTPGLLVFSIYIVGVILAVLTGLLLKNTMFKGEPSYFIMELPPYHAPRFQHIMLHTWSRLKQFIFRAGKVIVIVVALLSILNSLGKDGSFGNEDSENSVLATIGRSITPVFEPMGIEKDNWPATVGIFTGLFAKEAVVGTLNSLYAQIQASAEIEEGDAEEPFDFGGGIQEAFTSIPEALSGVFGGIADPLGIGMISGDEVAVAEEIEADEGIFKTMKSYFSMGNFQVYAYLLFILVYFPCFAALGAIVNEIGQALAWICMGYLTVLAWSLSTLLYQVTTGHQVLWIAVPVIVLAGIGFAFNFLKRWSVE